MAAEQVAIQAIFFCNGNPRENVQGKKYIIHQTRKHPSKDIIYSQAMKPLYTSPKNSCELQLHLVGLDTSNHLIVHDRHNVKAKNTEIPFEAIFQKLSRWIFQTCVCVLLHSELSLIHI